MVKSIKITLKDWEYKCGDKCCYDYGTIVYINDVKLKEDFQHNANAALQEILEHLGYEVEIEQINEN